MKCKLSTVIATSVLLAVVSMTSMVVNAGTPGYQMVTVANNTDYYGFITVFKYHNGTQTKIGDAGINSSVSFPAVKDPFQVQLFLDSSNYVICDVKLAKPPGSDNDRAVVSCDKTQGSKIKATLHEPNYVRVELGSNSVTQK